MKKNVKILIKLTTLSLFALSFTSCGKVSTVYYDAAWSYLENKQPKEAVDNFKLSIENEAKTKDALRGLGIAYIANDQYKEAIDPLIEALNMSNGRIKEIDYDINDYLGYAYEKSGSYEEALSVYNALIALHPNDLEAYNQRAVCFLHLNQMEEALADFSRVTSKKPDDYDTHIQIFFTIKNAGFEGDAKAYLSGILEDGKRKISDYDRGRMCYYLEDYSNGRVYLEKAKDFSNPDTILMLGKTYEAINDNTYAASLYSQYLDTKGNNAAVYNQLGVCRWKLEDYEGALSAFSFGIKLDDPEWKKELLFNEAVTYEYLLDFDMAKERFTEYLKLYPKDERASHEMLFLETRTTKEENE